jgi:hypothetical protein
VDLTVPAVVGASRSSGAHHYSGGPAEVPEIPTPKAGLADGGPCLPADQGRPTRRWEAAPPQQEWPTHQGEAAPPQQEWPTYQEEAALPQQEWPTYQEEAAPPQQEWPTYQEEAAPPQQEWPAYRWEYGRPEMTLAAFPGLLGSASPLAGSRKGAPSRFNEAGAPCCTCCAPSNRPLVGASRSSGTPSAGRGALGARPFEKGSHIAKGNERDGPTGLAGVV